MTRDEAKQFFKDHNVRYVLAQFVDIHGAAKAKAVPVSHFDEVLDTGAGFAGFAVWGLGIQPHGPDYMARGDLGAVSLVPWQPGYARIVCDGHVHGKPWEYDSRVVLKKQVALLKEQGLTSGDNACYRTKVGCLRLCESGPIATVYPEGIWYASMTKENIGALVESHLVNGKPLEDLVITKNPLPRD